MSRSRKNSDEAFAQPVWIGAAELELLEGRAMTDMLWRCDQLRAGQLYSRMMFDTQEEALAFAQKMQQAEPDQFFSVEAVEARQVWN